MRFQLGMGIPAKFWENMLLYEEEYIYYLLFLLIKSVQGISTWKSTLLMAFMLKKMMEKLVFFETCIQTALNLKLNIKLTMLRSWIWIRTSKRGHLYTSCLLKGFHFWFPLWECLILKSILPQNIFFSSQMYVDEYGLENNT